jgi:predicted  nucleic acid-binding Zn-ribbon protein
MLFSFGDLITLVVVLLIVIVFRAIDRNNRSLEKLKRFSDKITENLSALVEGKTLEMRDLSVELQAELKAGKEMIVHARTMDEQLRGKTSEIESIQARLSDYEKALTDLTSMSARVDTNMKKLRDESAFVDVVGRKIGETATRLDRVQKLIPEMQKAFAVQGRETLETARGEVINAVEEKVGALAAVLVDSDKKVKDFSSYIARLEAREAQTEKERIAGLAQALDAFEADLRGRLSVAARKGETLEDEVFTRLSSRIQANENTLAASIGTIELRLADYQGDVDYRVKVLEDAHHDMDALRSTLLQTMDKMAVSMRTEMQGIAEKHASELMSGWKSEVAGAEATREKLHASMGQLTAELEDLKARAYQDAEKQLSVFEEEFFADLRARSTLTQQKFQAWQAEMETRAEGF